MTRIDVPPQPQIKPKVRRQPMLIKNLGGSNTPKGTLEHTRLTTQ